MRRNDEEEIIRFFYGVINLFLVVYSLGQIIEVIPNGIALCD